MLEMHPETRDDTPIQGMKTNKANVFSTKAFIAHWSFLLLPLGLPALVYYLWICATRFDGRMSVPASMAELKIWTSLIPRPSLLSFFIIIGWLAFQAALQILAPGKWRQGLALRDGSRLSYRLNGLFAFSFTWLCWLFAIVFGWIPSTFVYDQLGSLLTAGNITVFLFCIFLYFYGKTYKADSRVGKCAHDFIMGTSLNPRMGNFDFKFFCESRPGLIAWTLVNFSFAAKQHQLHGFVSTPMILVCLFQFNYVLDYFIFEEAILSTWDIRKENFGWMLCWGSLIWVPFTYSLQALYLVNHSHSLSMLGILMIVLLNLVGFSIFRGANLQKHRFKMRPGGAIDGTSQKYIKTKNGSLLLTSGWWGISRHMNYLGDLILALSWCLPALFEHPLPYFYFIYFTFLLVHRDRRDFKACQIKYGKDWDTYCEQVRWRILPWVY